MSRMTCRLCAGTLGPTILDLGVHPPSNDFSPTPVHPIVYPLIVAQCPSCTLLQLSYDVSPESIFNKSYPLHSSKGSVRWLEHAKDLTEKIWDRFALSERSLVMEIGSNDGYLLKNLLGACQVIGIDPSGIPAGEVPTIAKRFTAELAGALPQADVVIALNTVAQIPNLHDFFLGLSRVLKPNGAAVLEFPDLVTTINGTQFDTIYHEHYSYLSVTALQKVLPDYGLHVYDLQFLPTHGGSLRVFIGSAGGKPRSRVDDQIAVEADLDLKAFAECVREARHNFVHFMNCAEFIGQKVVAYGAAARGNTFLNYCLHYGIWTLPTAVGDVNPEKIGKFLPGTGIPVVSEEDLIASDPDYVLILCWTWRDEAIRRLRNRGYKGAFVVALPKIEVIE